MGKMDEEGGEKMSGLLLAIGGKPKADEDDGDDSEPASGSSLFNEHATDAFDALKSGDRKAFTTALKSAITACYGDEDD